jgi:hypothetical protein
MSRRATKRLAWSLWGLYIALAIPAVILGAVNDAAAGSIDLASVLLHDVPFPLVLLVMMTVGALVASQRPENAIGWLFCAVALASESGALAIEYAVRALVTDPRPLPAGTWVGLFAEAVRSVGWYLLLTFLLLLFPTGKLPSPRWRTVAWLGAVSIALYTITSVIVPDAFANTDARLQDVPNPIAISPHAAILGPLQGGTILLAFVTTLACGASIVIRFRRAQGVERQQLKWFAYAVVCGLAVFAVIIASVFVLPPQDQDVLGYGFDLILIALPVATGIAILRYRLFDIDVIVRRTLVYGTLTATLAAVYFGCVVGAQAIAQALTGQQSVPTPVIVASTLLIAALFSPLRRRIQSFIDHRFYRRKYDAARTLDTFAKTLRTDLDLTELSGHLLVVVRETMQPAHASLWLRTVERRRLGPE